MLDFSSPKVMGVINLAPDSFCEVGRFQKLSDVLAHAEKLVNEGADILDIGAEPTNPQMATAVSADMELQRLMPVVEPLVNQFNVPVSIDTSSPEVMQAMIAAGVSMINDVRALTRPGAIEAVKDSEVMICLMHMKYPEGKVSGSHAQTLEKDLLNSIKDYLAQRVHDCIEQGIIKERIIIDPGIGGGNFGKSVHDNLVILRDLKKLTDLRLPILIGVSRKTFIGEVLKQPTENRLIGSIAAAIVAINNGASIIRAHDVKETKEAIKMVMEIVHA